MGGRDEETGRESVLWQTELEMVTTKTRSGRQKMNVQTRIACMQ